MTPERTARFVRGWVRFYTRSLPPPVAERRIGEIDADLHDHIAHERAKGAGDRRIALSIAGRMIRGVAADASWRRTHKEGTQVSRTAYRSAIRVALVTGLILLVPLVVALTSDGATWSVGDFVFAGVLLIGTGALIELALRRPGSIALRAAAIAIGVGAIAFGEADDAPGLVLFGLLLIVSMLALVLRTALRSD